MQRNVFYAPPAAPAARADRCGCGARDGVAPTSCCGARIVFCLRPRGEQDAPAENMHRTDIIKESRPDHATRGFPDRLPHTSSSSDKNIHMSRRASPSSRFPRTTRRTPPPPRSPLAQSCACVPRGARLSRARRTALLAAAPPARLQASHTFHAVWLSASTGLQSADTKMPVPRRMWIELPS